MPDAEDYTKEEKLAFEKQVLGVYVSGHPLEDYMGILETYADVTSQDFRMEEDSSEELADANPDFRMEGGEGLPNVVDQRTYTLGGLIADLTTKITKTNQNMAVLTVEDLYGSVEVVVFPKAYEKYRSLLSKDNKLLITGTAKVSVDSAQLILNRAVSFDDLPQDVWLQFETLQMYQLLEQQLYEIIDKHPGNSTIKILVSLLQNTLIMNIQHSLHVSEASVLIKRIQALGIEIFHSRAIECLFEPNDFRK